MAGFLTSFVLGFYGNSIIDKKHKVRGKVKDGWRYEIRNIFQSVLVSRTSTSKEFYENIGFKVILKAFRKIKRVVVKIFFLDATLLSINSSIN